MDLYLYRLNLIGRSGYDAADGFVVAAPDEARARSAPFCAWVGGHGSGCGDECSHIAPEMGDYLGPQTPCAWEDPSRSTCARLGRTDDGIAAGVVLRSFNAG